MSNSFDVIRQTNYQFIYSATVKNDQRDRQFACPSIAINQQGNESEYGAISKTFHIEYQKEKVELHDAFQFSMELLLPNDKVSYDNKLLKICYCIILL